MENSINFGKVIRHHRNQQELTQKKLSELSGCSEIYIQQLEAGKKDNPTTLALTNIASALKIPVWQMWYEAEGGAAWKPPTIPLEGRSSL